ncbi:DUF6580 family putative transport protein [Leptospira interrogans]|uniref:Uncharacterized protein n=19 Tax=Leptospira interrogans TaxID=173 RepID=A0A1B9FDR5_LEPIR|nr:MULTISPECIES: DUF6580 family putative transport protein [Leptospira]EMF43842.1 hypothetical protein LEP1GSC067_1857 [Leptospira interrogans serovar Lora str. TE 1992]EMF72880.1 hypothetical protein LEP1GSC148_2672 [Leptospira interrogans serovar Canicola str. LT1962]EMG09644.1 hypothetical protein LEP1GSC151_3944 [Leptospira interrogans serovar Grippotyphosa str. LT2186]EMG19479.1 hypothetical protein LEP1GSC150_5374 [Leptospira interrogans serovar Copenhageni str. LT2050]EMM82445.1 hypothe
MIRSKSLIVFSLILIAVASRYLPHPANFTPILAISLFAGAHFASKKLSLFLPVCALLISDLLIGFHDQMIPVYGISLLLVVAGWRLRISSSVSKIALWSLSGSVLFFLVTNFYVWLAGYYSYDLNGLVQCFIMAVPFFQNSLLGDLFYTTVLFGGFALIEKIGWMKLSNVPIK